MARVALTDDNGAFYGVVKDGVDNTVARNLPSAAYPARKLADKLNTRYIHGTKQQARVVAFGDSIALFKWHTLYPLLHRAFGGGKSSSGYAIGTAAGDTGWSLPGVTYNGDTGTVTTQTNAFAVWPSGVAELYQTGASRKYGTFGTNATWDIAKVYYAKETGSGTFSVQVGGTTEPGFESVSAAGTGLGVVTITRGTEAARELRVTNLTGTHRVVGVAFERSTLPGVVFANVSQGGVALNQMTAQAFANFQSFLTDFNPDIITFEMKENSTYYAASLDQFLGYVDAGAPTATFVGIGSTPVADNDAEQVVQNAQLRAACQKWGKVYWDGYAPFGSYTALNEMGWAGDGTHVAEPASSFLAGLLARDLGLFDHAGADSPSNVNAKTAKFTDLLTLGDAGSVNVSGPDVTIDGTGTGFVNFRRPDGTVTMKVPLGGPSSAAILPNTAQFGSGNARLTADTNGINVDIPAGGAKGIFGARKITASADGGLRMTPVPTASRPSGSANGDGTMIFDSDLMKPLIWFGGAWRDTTGTAV